MLNFFRQSSRSLIVRILLLLVVASFGLFWGINDVFRDLMGPKGLAQVGSTSISAKEFNRTLAMDIERLEQSMGQKIDDEMLHQSGLLSHTLDRMIHERLLQSEAARLGFVIPDDVIRDSIHQIPAFQTHNQFDHAKFLALLKRQNLNESQFIESLRHEMQRNMLVQLILSTVKVPKDMFHAYLNAYYETRDARTLKIAFKDQIILEQPPDEDLETVMSTYSAHFTVPEYRQGDLLILKRQDIQIPPSWSEEDLRTTYHAHLTAFTTPEKRQIQKLTVPASLKEKVLALMGNTRSLDTLKATLHTGTLTKSEWVQKDAFDADTAKIIFQLEEGKIAQLIQNDGSIILIHVQNIQPEVTKSFHDARSQVIHKLTYEAQQKILDERIRAIENELDGGIAVAEVARKYHAHLVAFNINAQGRNAQGQHIPELVDSAVKTIFSTEAQSTSTVFSIRDDLGIVHVKSIETTHQLSFDEGRSEAKKLWLTDRQRSKALEIAENIQKAAQQHKNWTAEAKKYGLHEKNLHNVKRIELTDKKTSSIPQALIQAIFGMNLNQFKTVADEDAYYIVTVIAKHKTDVITAEERKNFNHALLQQLQDDILVQYFQSLKERFPVKIHMDFKKTPNKG